MGSAFLITDYISWHYGRGLRDFFRVWGNLLWFVENFFSMRLLLQTLFSPWMRLTEEKTSGFTFENTIGRLIINLISRLIGLLVRGITITLGLSVALLIILVGIFSFILWIFLPAAVVLFVIWGFYLIFG